MNILAARVLLIACSYNSTMTPGRTVRGPTGGHGGASQDGDQCMEGPARGRARFVRTDRASTSEELAGAGFLEAEFEIQ